MNFLEEIWNRIISAFEDVFGFQGNLVPITNTMNVTEIPTPEQLPNQNDVDIAARTIWGEARGEGFAGMQGVMNVISNRVKNGSFGSGFAGVCKKPFQFSTWNRDDPNYPLILQVGFNDKNFQIAMSLAEQGEEGNLVDITKGALYYYSSSIETPYWAENMVQTVIIGKTIFLKPAEVV